MEKKGPVYFDRTGARVVAVSVLIGMVLTIPCGLLTYHFYLRSHTLPVNAQNRGVSVGFTHIPNDMDPYRGLIEFSASYRPPEVWQYDFSLPPIMRDAVDTQLVYWTKDGTQKTRSWSFYIACDPDRVYYSISRVEEVVLYQYNDARELIPLTTVEVRRHTSLRSIPTVAPQIKKTEPNPASPKKPSRSRNPVQITGGVFSVWTRMGEESGILPSEWHASRSTGLAASDGRSSSWR